MYYIRDNEFSLWEHLKHHNLVLLIYKLSIPFPFYILYSQFSYKKKHVHHYDFTITI